MSLTSLTPARRQYLQIKAQYPDAIVLFRLGDFYETFDDDAKTVAQACDIVLTSRPVGASERVPLAGVPYHAVETYIGKLVAAGHKIVIVDQMTDTPIKGLVPREVTRVVTPGTVTEPGLLDDRRNNYLGALLVDGQRAGIAYVDITTAEFAATELHSDRTDPEEGIWRLVQEELDRLQIAELLVTQSQQPGTTSARHITPYADWHFDVEVARTALLEHFAVASLSGFGCEGKPLAVCAAGAIVQYLRETQKAALHTLWNLRTYSSTEFMALDAATRRNLELVQTIREGKTQGSLLGVLDATMTAMGGRLLRQWISQPLLDVDRLNARLDRVQVFATDTALRAEVRSRLKGLPDLERLVGRVHRGASSPRDLLGIRKALEAVQGLRNCLEIPEGGALPLKELLADLDPCPQTAQMIAEAIAEDAPGAIASGGAIRPGFSSELDRLTSAAQEAKEWIANLEKEERQRTGIRNLKVGYNKVFGYYIEITSANLHAVPQSYIRKQTLVNAERFVTPELKEYEALVLHAEEHRQEIESRLFVEVCQRVAVAAESLRATAHALARIDVAAALAEVAVANHYVRPELARSDDLHVVGGRHPVIELTMGDQPFVANDVHMTADERVIILTGPNMSGKSTFIRQIALIVLMAQIGSYVPADRAVIGLADRIFTRIGAQDDISAGQSTFMVEMVEAANILNNATPHSLIILDEIGRGTSTYDGISIAWSVVEYIHNHPRLGSRTLFATHYHELVDLARVLPKVRNYNVAVSEQGDRVVFQHRIVPGAADKSYGIHVAQLAGMPRPVVHRAEEILKQLERDSAPSPGSSQAVGSDHVRPRQRRVEALQLALFAKHPALDELRSMDLNALTPIEALTRLYELQKMVLEEEERG